MTVDGDGLGGLQHLNWATASFSIEVGDDVTMCEDAGVYTGAGMRLLGVLNKSS